MPRTSRKVAGQASTRRADKTRGRATGQAGKAAQAAEKGGGAQAALLTMEQAIERLRTTRPTFYRWLRAGKIKGMKVGRQWRFNPDDVERFLRGQEPQIDLPVGTDALMEALGTALRKAGVSEAVAAHDDPVVRVVQGLVMLGLRSGASDIHVQPMKEPGDEPGEAQVRLRLDGVLHEALRFDLRLLPAVVERIKRMAACDPLNRRTPQDGRVMMTIGKSPVDLRVNIVPALYGEAVTMRLLHREAIALTLDQLPYGPREMRVLREAIGSPYGVIVVAGPAGSGKTTTLYCALKQLNQPQRKIITIEDPVEYAFAGMVQMQLNPKEGLTFESAMRSCLRADPDVIMMGEIRSKDAMQMCMQASLTGHLVMTTLHTNTAAGTLMRLRDLGGEGFVIGEAVRLVMAQRLVRKLCPHCSKADKPAAQVLEQAMSLAREGGVRCDELPQQFRKAVGCEKCASTGYRGRTVLAEMMPMTAQLGTAIRRGASEEELQALAVGQGMTTLAADGVRRAAHGETTLAEVLRVLAGG